MFYPKMNNCIDPKFDGIIKTSPIGRPIGPVRTEFIDWLLRKYNISALERWGRRPLMVLRKSMGLQHQFISNSIWYSLVENIHKFFANISFRLATYMYSILERASGMYHRGSLPESGSTLSGVHLALIRFGQDLTPRLATGDSRLNRTKTFQRFSFSVPWQKINQKFSKEDLDLIRKVVEVKQFAKYLDEMAFVESLFRPSVLAEMFMKRLLSINDRLPLRLSRKFGVSYRKQASLSKRAMLETDPALLTPGYDSEFFSQRTLPDFGFRNMLRWYKGGKRQHDQIDILRRHRNSNKTVFEKHAALSKRCMFVSRKTSMTLGHDSKKKLHKYFLVFQKGTALQPLRGSIVDINKISINAISWNSAFTDSPSRRYYLDGFRSPDIAQKPTITSGKNAVNRNTIVYDGIFPLGETDHRSSGIQHVYAHPPDMKFAVPETPTSHEFCNEIKKIKAQTETLHPQESPPVPEIDIHQLTNKVYEEIERKIRVERERRGL